MLYTYGRAESYDRALRERPTGEPPIMKLGAYGPTAEEPEGYEGGCAFRSRAAAEAAAPPGFSVYGLDIYDNERFVRELPNGELRLRVDAILFGRPKTRLREALGCRLPEPAPRFMEAGGFSSALRLETASFFCGMFPPRLSVSIASPRRRFAESAPIG